MAPDYKTASRSKTRVTGSCSGPTVRPSVRKRDRERCHQPQREAEFELIGINQAPYERQNQDSDRERLQRRICAEVCLPVKGPIETGHHYDDTKRYIEATGNLSPEDRHKVYEGNARRVYPRLDKALKAKGR